MDFFDDEAPSEVTLEQMNQLTEHIVKLRAEKEQLDAQVSLTNEAIKKAENQFIQYLKEAGMKNFKNEQGNFSITKRITVNQPADRDAFINYLKEKGEFEEMVTFNSNKLKSYVMAEIEEKAREGEVGWLPPGITKPSEFETISFRKK